MSPPYRVRAPTDADYETWRQLFRGYAEFYREEQTEAGVALVWRWLHDPDHAEEALVVEDQAGRLVGLAHYRPFPRPSSATTGCFLDDLFVAPDSRGHGAAEALFAELRRLAVENGWSVLRWITADDNYRARSKYDQLARRTMWITYDMPLP